MKFLIGEGGWTWLERASYRGAIGLFYESTWGGVLTFIIFGLICTLSVIGLITILKWLFGGKKRKKNPGQEWLKTGKF